MCTLETERKSSTVRPQLSSHSPSGLGIRGLPKQAYFMVLFSFIWSITRNLAFPYLWMYMDGQSGGGGMHFDESLIGFMVMIGGFSYILALPVGGSLCDRFGRRKIMAAFLIPQLIVVPAYAFAGTYVEFLLLYAFGSGLGAFYDVAFGAMVADLVQPSRREAVFGLSYMISNIATVVGPLIGGMIVDASGYPILFVYASFFVVANAVVFSLSIKESHPGEASKVASPKLTRVFRDRLFILFCFTALFTNIVYSQFYTLLSVYTLNVGFEPHIYGYLLSLNGAMVVTLQIPLRKGAMRLGPTRAFILAQLFFAIGFTYFMFAASLFQFLVADAVLTLGEIVFFPASSGFVANLAPPDMRGRYMALMGLFFGVGSAVGAQVVFMLYDTLALTDKTLIWGILGSVGFATLLGYGALFRAARMKREPSIVEKNGQFNTPASNKNKTQRDASP